MPRWLTTTFAAVALLIGAAFLAELVAAIRRRRQAAVQSARQEPACPPETERTAPGSARIILADYNRVVVTHAGADETVCVLRPPGEDPAAILRVARLVLAEDPYEELARQLGVSADGPTGGVT